MVIFLDFGIVSKIIFVFCSRLLLIFCDDDDDNVIGVLVSIDNVVIDFLNCYLKYFKFINYLNLKLVVVKKIWMFVIEVLFLDEYEIGFLENWWRRCRCRIG